MGVRGRTVKTKSKPFTTTEMEIIIAKYFNFRQNIIVPNLSWGFMSHEADMFIIRRKSGLAIEVEIKITKADLLNDFKKRHNHIDRQNRISLFYYAIPENIYESCKDLIPENAGLLVAYKNIFNGKEFISMATKIKPKRIKNARKLTVEEQLKIAHLGCMRIVKLKQKIITLQQKNK